MRKVIIICFVGAMAVGMWVLFSQSTLKVFPSSEISKLKTRLSACNDTLELLDFKIKDLLTLKRRSEDSQIILDSLKSRQQTLWKKYQALRKELAVELDNRPSFSVTGLLKKIAGFFGTVYTGLGLIVLVLFVIMILLRARAGRKDASLQKQFAYKEKIKKISMPVRDDVASGFQKAEKGTADITEENALDKAQNGNPQPAGEIEINKTNYEASGTVSTAPADLDASQDGTVKKSFSVPVSHLKDDSVEPVSRGFEDKPTAASDAPFMAENNQNLSDEKSLENSQSNREDWKRYEKERLQNAAVVRLARRGSTSSEISKLLKISQDEVELVIRANRENS